MTQSGSSNPGYIYAPYIVNMLPSKPPAINLDDFTIRKGLATKFTKKIVNPDWYGTVTLSNLGLAQPLLVQGWLFDDN